MTPAHRIEAGEAASAALRCASGVVSAIQAATAGWDPDEPFGAALARPLRAARCEARAAVEIVLAIYRSTRLGERVSQPPGAGTAEQPML